MVSRRHGYPVPWTCLLCGPASCLMYPGRHMLGSVHVLYYDLWGDPCTPPSPPHTHTHTRARAHTHTANTPTSHSRRCHRPRYIVHLPLTYRAPEYCIVYPSIILCVFYCAYYIVQVPVFLMTSGTPSRSASYVLLTCYLRVSYVLPTGYVRTTYVLLTCYFSANTVLPRCYVR